MGIRLLAAGIAALVVIGMCITLVLVSSQAHQLRIAPPHNFSTLAGVDWHVIGTKSAHYAMVVDVEAQRLEDARQIAERIVTPAVSHRYEEILIYVREPGSDINAAMRRIQWTQTGGFVEMVYEAVR